MIISNEVYNCLINQAIVMKHASQESGSEIAKKVVEKYFRNDRFDTDEKGNLIQEIAKILGK
ncbi:hypothetical protein JK636_23195 [Clostridium sp. YIM B02515]|uniref:Uncharacterized protein n=1 Tax=Clostridium rhizosphaerae TaxID=2803861 RepID=A0ABS1TH05_9CLOT|nr:hypothetical protein [Clostridium rhizosphaerae]MBL4938615.1 hypothetical protein [Clostridium rhizosphaerae]